MSPVWSVLIILAAAGAGLLAYALIVGGENIRSAFRELDNHRRSDRD